MYFNLIWKNGHYQMFDVLETFPNVLHLSRVSHQKLPSRKLGTIYILIEIYCIVNLP